MDTLSEVLRRHTDRLMSIPGVIGIGESAHDGRPCILILLSKLSADLQSQLPNEIDGFSVILQEVGDVRAL